MEATRTLAVTMALSLLPIGCTQAQPPPTEQQAEGTAAPAPDRPASFVNRVWQVAESPQVQVGSLRVFLADGTLVMTSPYATPAFGTWSRDDRGLAITEEGISYPVEILEQSEDTFRIRIRGPGEPIDIRFKPADDWLVMASEPAGDASLERISGSVHRREVEGGVWVIRTDAGSTLHPRNLPAAFQVEGLRIEAEVRRRDDMVSIGMVGPIVELVRIRRSAEDAARPSS